MAGREDEGPRRGLLLVIRPRSSACEHDREKRRNGGVFQEKEGVPSGGAPRGGAEPILSLTFSRAECLYGP
jgi:hypothetical protein